MMKKVQIGIVCLFVLLLVSCGNSNKDCSVDNTFISISYDNAKGIITLSADDDVNRIYKITSDSYEIASDSFSSKKELNVLALLKKKKDIAKELALVASRNSNRLEVNVVIESLKDTMFTFVVPMTVPANQSICISGSCAPLISSSSSSSVESELRKWLFRTNQYMPDSLIYNLTGIYRTLVKSDKDEYRTTEDIPVLKSLSGQIFKVSSAMQADYYALAACTNQSYIDSYVEQLVGNNFSGMATSLSQPLPCKVNNSTNGILCIVLIGINKDWTYQQQPVGLVALDNVVIGEQNADVSKFDFKNNVRVMLPSNRPQIFGNANVLVTNSAGNGIACNVSFRVSFNGDIKTVTVKRTKELCYYSRYIGYDEETPGPKDYVIESSKHNSPHIFNMKLHLVDGDNFIPYVIEDYHGNTKSGKIIHRASFTRSDAPSINIDNNIDIYN
ncbi:MAG: hypothetical protein IKQ03_03765 [Prevotella sp.]|nr:hypothetical protein [Prevotella sp.]